MGYKSVCIECRKSLNRPLDTKEGEEKNSSPHPSQNKNDESSFCKDELHSSKKTGKDDLQSSDTSKKTSPTKRKRFRSEEHTSELQSRPHLVCRLLLEKKNNDTLT